MFLICWRNISISLSMTKKCLTKIWLFKNYFQIVCIKSCLLNAESNFIIIAKIPFWAEECHIKLFKHNKAVMTRDDCGLFISQYIALWLHYPPLLMLTWHGISALFCGITSKEPCNITHTFNTNGTPNKALHFPLSFLLINMYQHNQYDLQPAISTIK